VGFSEAICIYPACLVLIKRELAKPMRQKQSKPLRHGRSREAGKAIRTDFIVVLNLCVLCASA
jgi:hypothetical protein